MDNPDFRLNLYSAAQIRQLEQWLIEQQGIPGETLMERAGACLFESALALLPSSGRVAVLCGPGNNGGDGYVAARLLREAGHQVEVLALTDPARLKGEARSAQQAWQNAGGMTKAFDGAIAEADLLIDALLGIGLERPLAGQFLQAVQAIDAHPAPVLAVDIPSGLTSEQGRALGAAVHADVTVTFIGLKAGLFSGDGPDHRGEIRFCDLGTPASLYRRIDPLARLMNEKALIDWLPPRPQDCHKGDFGHVLVIGGDTGLSGAAQLAGQAAIRSGAGLVSLATRAAHAPLIASACPVLMAHGAESGQALAALIEQATVLAIGPGLGRQDWGQRCWQQALNSGKPMVVDADALNLLADTPQQRGDWVLTPHPGEAARLLDTTAAAIQNDRFAAVNALQRRYGGVITLKGAASLVADGEGIQLCPWGNPGMASAGMGDTLTGVIAAMLAQGLSPASAAVAGVAIHARAGDLAAASRPRGMTALDLIEQLRPSVNPV